MKIPAKQILKSVSLVLFLFSLAACTTAVHKKDISHHGAVKTFATLPDGVAYPEGIARNPQSGDIFVSTFSFAGNNKVLRYDQNGKLLAQLDFGKTPLLGLVYNPADSSVYICNAGDLVGDKSQIQRVVADFSNSTIVEDVAAIPHIGAPQARTVGNPDGSKDMITFGDNAAAPNAMALTKTGSLLVSDSFQGAIFELANVATCQGRCPVTTVAHDGLLATPGFPPFGANGLALSADEATLYIANTGDDRILSLATATGKISVFAESINGADGLAMDNNGYLWAAANQADEIVLFESTGKVHGTLGKTGVVGKGGAHTGLLFPASLVIADGTIYVTNLALPLTSVNGDEAEESVSKYSISTIKIPRH